jgi:hypothetical protein
VLICAGCACQGRTREAIRASPIRDRLINREIKCGEIQTSSRPGLPSSFAIGTAAQATIAAAALAAGEL